jgi:prepilin-type N-terminal cleavage/methylation domain-containing protein
MPFQLAGYNLINFCNNIFLVAKSLINKLIEICWLIYVINRTPIYYLSQVKQLIKFLNLVMNSNQISTLGHKKVLKNAFSLIELSIVVLIIGILIAGVTQGSRLVRQSKINVAQSLTSSSPVASIPDLTLWLEPTLDNSITSATNGQNPENGDLISSWNDNNLQSLSKINLTQATSINRPTYTINGINGLPSLSFSGNQNLINSNPAGPITINSNKYTIIVVVKTIAASNQTFQQIFEQGPNINPPAGTAVAISFEPVSNKGLGLATYYNDYFPNTYTQNKIWLFTAVASGTNAVTTYTNSNNAVSSNLAATNFGPSVQNLMIGNRIDTMDQAFQGLISEIIVYDRALKKSEVVEINNYLSKKYAIVVQ